MNPESRYQVQERFPAWGPRARERLARAVVTVVGVGALGGHAAGLLARAGVGTLRLVDPDYPSLDNLHRQTLYTEADLDRGLCKAEAAARYLGQVNSEVRLEPVGEPLTPANARELLAGADAAVDGLDQIEARYLLNEACLELGVPWVHAGVVGSRGQLLVLRPGVTPCLRCWLPPPAPGSLAETPAELGVISPAPACLAALQAAEVFKLLLGDEDSLLVGMLLVDAWPLDFRVLAPPHPSPGRDCPACQGRYQYLN